MDKNIRNSLISLISVALASAAIWWTEVQLRGWDGLQWVDYSHFAIPIGMVLFLTWLNFHCAIPALAKRIVYLILVAAFATGAYFVARWSLLWHFGAFRVWAPFQEWPLTLKLSTFSIFVTFPAMPLVFFFLSWCFGVRFRRFGLAAGLIIYALAVPLGMLFIALVNHRGQPDSIHAIKTGFCIPFLMAGLGLPFIFHRREEIQPEN